MLARWEVGTISELVEGTEAGFNLLALLAGAIWFLVKLEARIKVNLCPVNLFGSFLVHASLRSTR